jgi:adenylate kinase family enzyme
MVRGVYIKRASPTRFTVAQAVERYLREVTSKKKESTQEAEVRRAAIVKKFLGKYSMAAVTPDVITQFREDRLAGNDRKDPVGNPVPRANDTVRLGACRA